MALHLAGRSFLFFVCVLFSPLVAGEGLLPSWNEGEAKSAILAFVNEVATEGGEYFIPVPERIATFDQDGTLWVEHPLYTQFEFAIDNLRDHAASLGGRFAGPLRALLNGDIGSLCRLTIQQVEEIVTASHAGMSVDEFHDIVAAWLREAKHPRFNRHYTELVYQPMLEVIELLRAHQFKVYIVSGGGQEFIRVYSEGVYGIPPEHVIGTAGKVKYENRGGVPLLRKQPSLLFLDDKGGKPEGINLVIGRRPVAAFGNSDGDVQMLEWTQGRQGKSFQLLVHHDDEEREYAYDKDTKIGALSAATLKEAYSRGWVVVSMKRDWKTVFAEH